ncbi:Enoyl-CoA hydratase/isomerase [Desulfarculus baarsii DSM 2075]|uniref:Enoyl-CoA hydratase/isomerase n=1 Tax=Desulfarculus baarsii (strain ATCC 33931 / DSM 2075 / LMG 7858 / VKM B-1802 / 2st14) TaxID=644282 RepID=E1QFR8_DESB2|nr:enoyl-CoA hydratase/isomerase family protein [Desulfarculus baarsii]ADK84404.1 Enoyl-CoA hydratase/isomerase [Desulfarculus baarsii DSM 2075]
MSKVTFSMEDQVAVVSMDDGKANAFDFEMFAELNQAMDQAEAAKAKLVVFQGREGLFCGGLNLKLLPTLPPEKILEMVNQFGQTMCRVFLLPIPTVAAIAGHSIAGGMQLAFACDRRVVKDGPIRLQMNEMLTGMVLPSWMLRICKSVIPTQWQAEVLLHARTYSPAEALAKNIIHAVAPADQDIVAAAKQACQDLLALEPGAYSYTKRLMHGPGLAEDLAKLPAEMARK